MIFCIVFVFLFIIFMIIFMLEFLIGSNIFSFFTELQREDSLRVSFIRFFLYTASRLTCVMLPYIDENLNNEVCMKIIFQSIFSFFLEFVFLNKVFTVESGCWWQKDQSNHPIEPGIDNFPTQNWNVLVDRWKQNQSNQKFKMVPWNPKFFVFSHSLRFQQEGINEAYVIKQTSNLKPWPRLPKLRRTKHGPLRECFPYNLWWFWNSDLTSSQCAGLWKCTRVKLTVKRLTSFLRIVLFCLIWLYYVSLSNWFIRNYGKWIIWRNFSKKKDWIEQNVIFGLRILFSLKG